ncbi:PAS domain S-box protein [Rhodoferax sp.]|uniref:PAS domain S-box protein n=1 Tax=Rhodoferax sp. TaxID=50421 RepID=UPI002851E1E4|nr:PAS domain S-box protein [Rhodoferax sp.]MDR3368985.1 PAS domain S-box protein [Rhodoferax sp.]
MSERSLSQLMTWNIVTVGHDASLARAAEIMETARISSVLVVELDKPVGIITERDILRALETAVPSQQAVATVMGRPLVTARENLALHDAYHLMAEKGVRHLLVIGESNRPVGIVSESDFRFHLGLEFYRRLQDVRTVMSARIPVLHPNVPLREAVAAMAARDANCVVVAVDGAPVGMITERDAVRFYRGANGTLEQPLADVMSSPVATIPVGTHLHDAMQRMQSQHIRHLVVVGDDGRVAGILSEHDVVRQLETEYLDFALRESRRTRKELQDSEMRRHAVFNQASEYMAILDLDGTLRDINKSSLDLIGNCSTEEVVGKPLWNTPWWSHDPAQQALLRQAVADLASGRSSRFEATHPAADGSLHFVDFQLQPILDDTGKLALALAESSDITDRKRAECELRQFQRAVEQSPVSIIMTDTDARVQYVNPKFTEITGYSRDEILGQNPRLLKSGITADETYQQLWANLSVGKGWTGELCNRRKNGDVFWELARILPITDAVGQVTHYLAVKEDVTERHRVEEQRRLALTVFQSSHDGILVTDVQGTILDVNKAFSDLTGYARDEAIGQSAQLLNSGHHDAGFFRRLFETVALREYWQGEIWNRTKAGALSVVLMTISAVRDDAGQLTHYVGVFTDVTERKESEQHLEHLAHHDALTDLPNRSLFRDRLQQALKNSHRDNQSLALLFIDLDRFKEVNDVLGHVAGDQVLVEAAQRITSCVRTSDTVARMGGDEFTVVLQGLESQTAVERVAGKVIEALAAPYSVDLETANLSASIGIAIFPNDAQDLESLTKAADQAMYQAKAKGRNGFTFFADCSHPSK